MKNKKLNKKLSGNRGSSGFSLLELMLVLAIMGILMAVVAINVLGAGDKAKITATKATLKTIKTQLAAYHLETSCVAAGPPDTDHDQVPGQHEASGRVEDGPAL